MSKETKWTCGAWSVRDCPRQAAQTDRKDDGRIKLVDFNDGTYEGTVAIVQTEESEHNAHLIAAAPDLFEALEMVLEMLDMDGFGRDAAIDVAHAALAKARGDHDHAEIQRDRRREGGAPSSE